MNTTLVHRVRILCTDRATHASRELAVIDYGDDPELRDAMLADDELTEQEAEAVYRWDRITCWTTRDARRGGRVQTPTAAIGWTERGDVEVGDLGDGQGPLWRFRCPTCRRDVPMRHDTLVRLMEGVIGAGYFRVDISMLPANMA